ncbi:hypothetical protein B4144_3785 [Bacillus atrophaeus]|nr:hypothetical protein B4144_3785 [Bacillus atrophaeus]
MIDHQRIARQQLTSNKPGQLFDVCYEIPFELTQDKENVT